MQLYTPARREPEQLYQIARPKNDSVPPNKLILTVIQINMKKDIPDESYRLQQPLTAPPSMTKVD